MPSNHSLEKKLLTFSVLSALLFALMGIGLGVWMGSLVILFDGTYSLVSLLLSALSLVAAWYISSAKTRRTNPRKELIEPIVIAIKGFAISLMCVASFTAAVQAILAGGREVDTGLALAFGIINVAGCLGTYWILAKRSKQSQSALLDAESKQWLMDTVISAAVMAGFVLAAVLTHIGFSHYALYADPMMVILASLYFIIVPVKMTLGALSELHTIYANTSDDGFSEYANKAS